MGLVILMKGLVWLLEIKEIFFFLRKGFGSLRDLGFGVLGFCLVEASKPVLCPKPLIGVHIGISEPT